LGINDALYFVESLNNKKILYKGRQLNSSNRDTLIKIYFFDRFIQYLKNNSIFHSVYLFIKGNMISNKYKISYNSKPSVFSAYQQEAPINKINLEENISAIFIDYYNKNLREIADHSKNYNAKVIFVTQVISNNHWLYNYLNKINILTMNFCKNNKIKCINLEDNNLSLKENHFYDGIHTTPDGSKIIGEFISDKFNKLH